MKAPPLLPEIVFSRVQRVGSVHGACVLYVAGFLALMTASIGDIPGTIIGLLVAGAGAIEHHGAALLGHRQSRGVTWLWFSQVVLFGAIAIYCAMRLTHEVVPAIPTAELRALLEKNAEQVGMTLDQYMHFFYRFSYRSILVGTALYQGGLGWYYFRRRAVIQQFLADSA